MPGLGIIRQIVLAVFAGGATFLLSSLLDGDTTWTMMLSVFIGGVVLLVQHLISLEDESEKAARRLEERMGELAAQVTDRLDRVDRGVRLLEALENSAVETAVPNSRPVSGFVERVAKFAPPTLILGRLVNEEIRALHDLLRGLEGDSVSFSGEDRDWLLALTRGTRKTISATSTTTADGGRRSFSDGFWKSELGRAYLAAQREAVTRGVTVRRVFILNHEKILRNSDFQKICEEQRAAGIIVHSVVVPGGSQFGGGVTGWCHTFRISSSSTTRSVTKLRSVRCRGPASPVRTCGSTAPGSASVSHCSTTFGPRRRPPSGRAARVREALAVRVRVPGVRPLAPARPDTGEHRRGRTRSLRRAGHR